MAKFDARVGKKSAAEIREKIAELSRLLRPHLDDNSERIGITCILEEEESDFIAEVHMEVRRHRETDLFENQEMPQA